MHLKNFIFILALILMATGCLPSSNTQQKETEAVDPPPEETMPPSVILSEVLSDFEPLDILLQLDFEPTFSTPENMYPFGRVSPFTLYASGLTYYLDEGENFNQQQVMEIRLSPQETIDLLERVNKLGIQNLESYTDFCFEQQDGNQMCVADAAITVFRAYIPGEGLREIKIYHDFADDLEAFQQITDLLIQFEHAEAQRYAPQQAALFIRSISQTYDDPVYVWPLNPERLPIGNSGSLTAIALLDEELDAILDLLPQNTGRFIFEVDGDYYDTTLIPWLPGEDYTADLTREFPPLRSSDGMQMGRISSRGCCSSEFIPETTACFLDTENRQHTFFTNFLSN